MPFVGPFPPDDWTICCAMAYIAWAWRKTDVIRYYNEREKRQSDWH